MLHPTIDLNRFSPPGGWHPVMTDAVHYKRGLVNLCSFF